jgi:lysozyme
MRISEEGKDLIKSFEGCRLNAYKCSAGVPTIGYGNTYYPNGDKVQMNDVITLEQAIELFDDLIVRYERIVNSKLKVDVKQNEFDALVSHTYNTGGSTTLFRLVNAKADKDKIKNWFTTKYITANKKRLIFSVLALTDKKVRVFLCSKSTSYKLI